MGAQDSGCRYDAVLLTPGGAFLLVGLLAVSGILDATAVLNTASFSIPVFYASVFFALLVIGLSFFRVAPRNTVLVPLMPRSPGVVALGLLIVLWSVPLLQVILGIADFQVQLPQVILRTSLIGFFITFLVCMQEVSDREAVLKIFTFALAFYFLYGLYDFTAQLLKLPRFLDFLRNSQSILVSREFGDQGWLGIPRAVSLSAEPSHTGSIILLGMYIGFMRPEGNTKRQWLGILAIVFALLTVSRTVWVMVAGVLLMAIVYRLVGWVVLRYAPAIRRSIVALAVLILPLASALTVIAGDLVGNDVSAQKREITTLLGFNIFFDHYWIGTGFFNWNSYYFDYPSLLSSDAAPGYLHNMLGIYLSSLGIWGVLYVILPVVLLLHPDNQKASTKVMLVTGYCLMALGVDFTVLGSFWTLLAVYCCDAYIAPRRGKPEPLPAR